MTTVVIKDTTVDTPEAAVRCTTIAADMTTTTVAQETWLTRGQASAAVTTDNTITRAISASQCPSTVVRREAAVALTKVAEAATKAPEAAAQAAGEAASTTHNEVGAPITEAAAEGAVSSVTTTIEAKESSMDTIIMAAEAAANIVEVVAVALTSEVDVAAPANSQKTVLKAETSVADVAVESSAEVEAALVTIMTDANSMACHLNLSLTMTNRTEEGLIVRTMADLPPTRTTSWRMDALMILAGWIQALGQEATGAAPCAEAP